MAPSENAIARDLACFIVGEGGRLCPSDAKFQKFYAKNPQHRGIIKASGGNLQTFCKRHPEYFKWKDAPRGEDQRLSLSSTSTAAAVSLAQFVTLHGGTAGNVGQFYGEFPKFKQFIQGRLKEFCAEHGDVLHYDAKSNSVTVPRKKVKSSADATKASGTKGALSGASAAPKETVKGVTGSSSSTPATMERVVASKFQGFLREMGGCLSAAKLPLYYQEYPSHKGSLGKLRAFCERNSDILTFVPVPTGGPGFVLPADMRPKQFACCNSLRKKCASGSGCPFSHAHQPESPCMLGRLCRFGHGARPDASELGAKRSACEMFDIATESSATPLWSSSDTDSDHETHDNSSRVRLPVRTIRWAHSTIEICFQTGKFLIDTLQELLDESLEASSLPMFDVLEVKDYWYAVTGNRRLWVLREYARITGVDLEVDARRLNPKAVDSPWVSQKMTTETLGKTVEFVARGQAAARYPSMMFALAASMPEYGGAPDGLDIMLGRKLLSAPGKMGVWALAEKGRQDSALVRRYLSERPHLFQVEDDGVSLAGVQQVLSGRQRPKQQQVRRREEEEHRQDQPGQPEGHQGARGEEGPVILNQSKTSSAPAPGGATSRSEPDPWQQGRDPWQSYGSSAAVGCARAETSPCSTAPGKATPSAPTTVTQEQPEACGLTGRTAHQPQDAGALLEIIPCTLLSEDALLCDGSLLPLQKIILDVGSRPRAFFARGQERQGARLLHLIGNPSVVCSKDDIEYIVERAGGDPGCEAGVLARTKHRLRLLRSAQGGVLGVTIRLGHSFHGVCGMMFDILGRSDQSVLVAGLADSGKTTILREAARVLSESYDVLAIDGSGELQSDDGSIRHLRVDSYDTDLTAIVRAIAEHAIEVLVADDLSPEVAWALGAACKSVGARMVGAARVDFSELAAAWSSSGSTRGEGNPDGLAKERLSFDIVVETSRADLNTWRIIFDPLVAIDSVLKGEAPACQLRSREPATGDVVCEHGFLQSAGALRAKP